MPSRLPLKGSRDVRDGHGDCEDAWERLVLIYAILLPPVLVLVFAALMASESSYTAFTRLTFMGTGS